MSKSSNSSGKISNKLKKAIIIILLLCLLLNTTACGRSIRESASEADNLPQLNSNDGMGYITSIPIYYRFMDSSYVLPVDVDVTAFTNEMPEAALLRTLMSGKGTGGVFRTAIPADCELIDLIQNGKTLYATFNKALIDKKNYSKKGDMRMAMCEIVNTLAKFSGYSVQILIDKSGNSIGERVTYRELGIESSKYEPDAYASPFKFTQSLIATPEIMLKCCLDCIINGDYSDAALLFSDFSGTGSVNEEELKSLFTDKKLSSYTDPEVQSDGSSCIARLELSFSDTGSELIITCDITLNLTVRGSVYMISYDEFAAICGGLML